MSSHRNHLVILASGLRCDVFSHVGSWPLRTPRLDQLATAGIGLGAVTASPAALPAMVSILTGLHPRQHGVLDDGQQNPKTTGWPKQFADAGYHVAGIGRIDIVADQMHEACRIGDLTAVNADDCAYLRFAKQRGLLPWVRRLRQQRIKAGPLKMGEPIPTGPTDDIDGFIARQAVMMIERLPKDRPWLMIVAFTGPGNDLPAPPSYFEQVPNRNLADGFSPADFRVADFYAESQYPRALLQKLRPEDVATIRRNYLARVLLLDQAVGLLRGALDRCGHAQNTWISLTADHGKLLGERGMFGHRSLLGASAYVPLWVLPPDGKPKRRAADKDLAPTQQLVSTVDLCATLCAVSCLDSPPGCMGRSILPAMYGHEVGGESVISEFGTRLMLETMKHRVIYDVDSEQPKVLFDLVNDPAERADLIDDPRALTILDMLRWQLAGSLMHLRPVRAA